MTSSNFTYISLIAFTLLGPLARSFEPQVRFHARWFALWPAIVTTASVFIAWDVLFTRWGVWGFNSNYVLGIFICGLPLEEWLFFVAVPYACVFIYDCLNHFWPASKWSRFARPMSAVAAVACFATAYEYRHSAYSFVSFGLSGVCLTWAVCFKSTGLAQFLRAFVVALLPFFLVNGVLTGTGLHAPVVWYENAETTNIRMGTIPLEDAFYLLPLLWLVVIQYEWWITRRSKQTFESASSVRS